MSVMSLDALQDLFLLFANVGRKDKVVLGLTDTMYKKRLSTARNIDSLGKIGFRAMMEESPGLIDGLTVNVDYVFMQNLGESARSARLLASLSLFVALTLRARLPPPFTSPSPSSLPCRLHRSQEPEIRADL